MFFLYILNTLVKLYVNKILFIIWSINLFLCIILDYKSLKYKHLIDEVAINLWYFKNFANMKYVRKKKCNLMVG